MRQKQQKQQQKQQQKNNEARHQVFFHLSGKNFKVPGNFSYEDKKTIQEWARIWKRSRIDSNHSQMPSKVQRQNIFFYFTAINVLELVPLNVTYKALQHHANLPINTILFEASGGGLYALPEVVYTLTGKISISRVPAMNMYLRT